jgi:hypothetical protein
MPMEGENAVARYEAARPGATPRLMERLRQMVIIIRNDAPTDDDRVLLEELTLTLEETALDLMTAYDTCDLPDDLYSALGDAEDQMQETLRKLRAFLKPPQETIDATVR